MEANKSQRDIVTIRYEEFPDEWNTGALSIHVGTSSIIGTRKTQQDALFEKVDGDRTLAIVCDGMGGMNGGELASETAVRILAEDTLSRKDIPNIPLFFKEEAIKLDAAVCALTGEDGKPLNGGTTIVAVMVEKNNLYWLSVGDSKIYIIRNQEIVPVNREHNYRLRLNEEFKQGLITGEEYKEKEKQAEALISYLGIGNLSLMDVNQIPFKLEEGDIIILCSDGLYKRLSDMEICQYIYYEEPDMQRAANRLTDIVKKRTNKVQDNTSVILLQYGR